MKTYFAAAVCALLPLGAQAATAVAPVSYSYTVVPGTSGGAYRDDTYNGTTGQLTDGVSATSDWQATDGFNAPGPNMGWQYFSPQIQFNFDQAYDFVGLVMNYQDGQGTFGVGKPESITVNGLTSPLIAGGTIRTARDTTMDLSALAPTDTLLVTVNRGFQWTLLSEFTFTAEDASPVPLPAGLPLLIVGIGAFGLVRRKAKAGWSWGGYTLPQA